MGSAGKTVRVLAACSGGGHWEQMMLLRPALDAFDVHYATTIASLGARDGIALAAVLPDTSRSSPWAAVVCAWMALRLAHRLRPDVVLSTGALPGLICLVAGRLFGARTLWLDSVANTERLSMSGKWAGAVATRRMTQWEHLSDPTTLYDGSLL